MQGPSRYDLYRTFTEFVANDLQRERTKTNRRMFGVFLWCFLVPTLLAAVLILMMRFGVIPREYKRYLDWLILIFPVCYSLYILSSEVLIGIPFVFKRGGMANSVAQAYRDSQWRDRVCEGLRGGLRAGRAEWTWICANYRIDLNNLHARNKYLTGLAGAVFFLLIRGIDYLGEGQEEKVMWVRNPVFGWMETGNDWSPIVGLVLFLTLFYLSGNQSHQTLSRYLDCAELMRLDHED